MDRRLRGVHLLCLFLGCVLTPTKFQGVKSEIAPKGVGKPQNCNATAFSSTAVCLTWNAPTSGVNSKPGRYAIQYRPLKSLKGNFTVLQVGKKSFYLVKNLDAITYYAFRIVRSDTSGNQDYCEVLAKTLPDAVRSLQVRAEQIPGGLKVKWNAVNLPDANPIYRLFFVRSDNGKVNLNLLYEGNRTYGSIKGTLSRTYLLYVSVVANSRKLKHEAANIVTYPTKQATVPGARAISSTESNSNNKTLSLRISIDALDSNFARISWNAVDVRQRGHVTYKIRCKAGNVVKNMVTSNTSVMFSGLLQLTTYKVTVRAQEIDGKMLPVLSEVLLSTPDKDECADTSLACSENAECVNTRGSYFCRCLQGWTGDGKTCKEEPNDNGDLSHCDEHFYVNVTWMRTLQGQTALAPCPAKSRGIAKRICLQSSNGAVRWGVPDLSECTSDEMANIAQQLQDPSADVTDIARQLAEVTAVVTHAQIPLQTGDLKLAVDVIEKISQKGFDNIENDPPSLRDEKVRKIAQALVKSSSNILHNSTLDSWKFMPKDSISSEASKLLKGMDTLSVNLAKAAISSDALLSEAPNVVLSAMSTKESDPLDQRLPPRNELSDSVLSNSVLLPGSVVKLQQLRGNQSETQFITFVSYRNLRALMQPDDLESRSAMSPKEGSDGGKIESDVVSVSLYPMNINSFEEPVTLILRNTEERDEDQANCVFWNMNGSRGSWSGAGCHLTNRNKSHTTCQCYHLTSFAVLMRVKDIHKNDAMKQHSYALGLISYIGVSISIVALCMSFLTFVFLRFRNTQNRYFVHANLAVSLGLAETLFLFGISRTENKIVCKTIAITLHYLFLASFSWMALEGVILYLMLVKIFRSKARAGRDRAVFLLCGWGIPAVVVAVSAALFHEGYGTSEFCWLSLERHFSWAFVGPVLLVCLFNFICLAKTFMVMSSRGSAKKSDTTVKKIRYWSKGCALLSCLLGLTWIFGVFVVNEDTIFIAYLFNIFNTLQGLLIFLFHCIGDDKVRAEYLRLIRCQSRSVAYAAARPWWSKSDSMSRSRASEKVRRSTLQSNVEAPKATVNSPIQEKVTLLPGAEYVALRQSLNRPVKVRKMYEIAEDEYHEDNTEREIESQLNFPRAENVIDTASNIESNEVECDENSEETSSNTQPVETGLTCSCEHSSLPNLPDVIQNECQDTDKSSNDIAL